MVFSLVLTTLHPFTFLSKASLLLSYWIRILWLKFTLYEWKGWFLASVRYHWRIYKNILWMCTHTNIHHWLDALKINVHSAFDLWIIQKKPNLMCHISVKGSFGLELLIKVTSLFFMYQWVLLSWSNKWAPAYFYFKGSGQLLGVFFWCRYSERSTYYESREEDFYCFWKPV